MVVFALWCWLLRYIVVLIVVLCMLFVVLLGWLLGKASFPLDLCVVGCLYLGMIGC